MKNMIRSLIAFGVVLCVGASAGAAPCVPVPPKDTTGHVELLHQGESAAASYFVQNGCNWNGFDQLNGTDGLVLDVTGQAGSASVSGILGDTALLSIVVQGYFVDEGCSRIDGADWHITTSVPAAVLAEIVTIPANAKYMVIDNTSANNGND
ncbi:MAG TPA: hypothetical protein VIG64_01680, partial [Actinomycetota bacterium]